MQSYIKDNPEAVSVDVQIMLLPNMTPDMQQQAQTSIIAKIQKKNGTLKGAPYQLTDGTSIIRASMSPGVIDEIAEDPRIYWVKKTVFFHG